MPPRIRRRITSARREQIEEEQKRLEKSIVRPFDTLNGLPVSYNKPPPYEEVLKNPLTMKDSGVFYRSLLKSRSNYVHICPMFRLYWVKQSSYAKKLAASDKPLKGNDAIINDRPPVLSLDVSARDVMVKLCDAALTLGPHNFDIRLFIVKDERSEKARKDIKIPTNSSVNPYNSNVNTGSSNVSVTGNVNNVNGVNNVTNNIPNNPTTQPINKPVETPAKGLVEEKKDGKVLVEESTKKSDEKEVLLESSKKDEKAKSKAEEIPIKLDEKAKKSDAKAKAKADEKAETKKSKKSTRVKEKEEKEAKEKEKEEKEAKEKEVKAKEAEAKEAKAKEVKAKEVKAKEVKAKEVKAKEAKAKDKMDAKSDKSKTTQPSTTAVPPPPPTVSSSSPPPPPHHDPHNMQSIENTIMISNLNTIARTDASLNQLMNEVALGKAEQKQILIFQGYIKRAREMGPQPHHAYLFANQPTPKIAKKPIKDKKPKEILPRNLKLTAFQEKYSQDATILFEFVENPNVRFMLPKTAICEVLPPSTMMNAEDGDNSDNSDVLVSFIWVHNQKEIDIYQEKLAKYENAIKEREEEAKKLEEETKNEDVKNEEAKGDSKVDGATATDEAMDIENAEEGKAESVDPEKAETKDSADVEEEPAEEQDQTILEEVTATSEIDANSDANADVPEDNSVPPTSDANPDVKEEGTDVKLEDQGEVVPVQRRMPPKRSKKKVHPRRAPKKPVPPVQPETRFTTLSFTIHGVPARFIPIVVNSFEPYEQAQSKMKTILDTGLRTTSFYLWYQVDGKLDEKLAEEIRTQLVQEEKKLTGVVTSAKEIKKRPKKPKPEVPVKRIKVEEVPASNEAIDPSLTMNNPPTQPPGNGPTPPSTGPAITGQ